MVGSNLKDQQLQQIVDKTLMEADLDKDGKISFEEFKKMVENTDVSMSMTLGMSKSSMHKLVVLLGMALANHLRLQTSSRWLDLHHEAACTICPRQTTYNSHPRRVQFPDTDQFTNVSPRHIKGHTRAGMSDVQTERLILRSRCPQIISTLPNGSFWWSG